MQEIHSRLSEFIPATRSRSLDCFSKEISEKVGQTCRFAANPARDSPPFQKYLLRNNPGQKNGGAVSGAATPTDSTPPKLNSWSDQDAIKLLRR
jgi:hypothetical protein